MISKRVWFQKNRFGTRQWQREGWYLFGFIPLYCRDLEPRGLK